MTAVPGPDATPGQAGLPPLPPKWTGKFRKRPAVVEAVQLVDDDACDWDEIARWCGGLIYNIETSPGAEPQTLIDIPTLEGTMTAGDGWWVVRGVKGEFYPVRPDIFEASHEPAVTPDPGDVTPGQATPEQVLAAVAIVLFEGDEPVELRAERAVEILERNGVNYRGEMAAAAVAQPAPGDLDAAYLYHWRFDRGEEFGLYWHRADADAQAAKHAGEGLTEVLGMAILGERPEPQPEPAPPPLGTALAALECIRQSHEPGTLAHDLARKALDDAEAAHGEARGDLALYGEALREIARRTNGYDPGTNEHAVHQVAVSVLALNGVPDDAEPAS